MRIERILAERFRNLDALRYEPHPRFNIFEGANGQGKTNLLEALSVLAGLRSFRTTRLGECVQFGADQAALGARVAGRGVRVDIGVEIQGPRSRVFVDGRAVSRNSEALGTLAAVIFCAADLGLPHGEPAARRRWIDRAIFGHRPGYLAEVRRFEAALAQRNALLRQADRVDFDARALDAYDGVLAEAGAVLRARRQAFVATFGPQLQAEFAAVAAPGRVAGLRYEQHDPDARAAGPATDAFDADKVGPDAVGLDEAAASASIELAALVEQLRGQLGARRRLDLRRGTTSVGPQRDDVGILLDGRPAREHASAGQSRALVIAMKIAEIRSLEATLGEPPVLLLDDLSSELDAERNAAMMHHLDALGGQVFLTTTDARYIQLATAHRVCTIAAGQLVTAVDAQGRSPQA